MKRDVSDGGAVVDVPVNILDCDPQLGLYAKPFIRLFEDRYYFWGTVEILRKLFQTSFVVLVRIVDKRFDLLYTLLVIVMAITFQGHFSPFVDDLDDRLSIMFLVNEFLLLLSLVGITYVKGWDDRQNGAVLIAMQVLPLGKQFHSANIVSFLYIVSEYMKQIMHSGSYCYLVPRVVFPATPPLRLALGCMYYWLMLAIELTRIRTLCRPCWAPTSHTSSGPSRRGRSAKASRRRARTCVTTCWRSTAAATSR